MPLNKAVTFNFITSNNTSAYTELNTVSLPKRGCHDAYHDELNFRFIGSVS